MAEIHDLFGNDGNGSNNNNGKTRSEIIKHAIQTIKDEIKTENEMKMSLLENALMAYDVAMKDVNMDGSVITNMGIAPFLHMPFPFFFKDMEGEHIHLIDEKKGDTTYHLTIIAKTEQIGNGKFSSNIAVNVFKKEDGELYSFNHRTREWELEENDDIGEVSNDDMFSEESIKKFLNNIFGIDDEDEKEDAHEISEYQESIFDENGSRAAFMEICMNNGSNFTDDDYKMCFTVFADIFELYEQVNECMTFTVTEEFGIILIPREKTHMGYAIGTKDGFYHILNYISEEDAELLTADNSDEHYLVSVFRTKSINTVKKYIKMAADAKRGKRIAWTIPVSSKNIVAVTGGNIKELLLDIKETAKNGDYTTDELYLMTEFAKYLKELHDMCS